MWVENQPEGPSPGRRICGFAAWGRASSLRMTDEGSVLGLEVAGFATFEAVVLPVLAEADLVFALAERAVAVALASVFDLLADVAAERFGHVRNVSRQGAGCKVTLVRQRFGTEMPQGGRG